MPKQMEDVIKAQLKPTTYMLYGVANLDIKKTAQALKDAIKNKELDEVMQGCGYIHKSDIITVCSKHQQFDKDCPLCTVHPSLDDENYVLKSEVEQALIDARIEESVQYLAEFEKCNTGEQLIDGTAKICIDIFDKRIEELKNERNKT